jgi:hypothetical protein
MKQCTNCGKERTLSEFGYNKLTNDGRQSWCRVCDYERILNWKRGKSGLISIIYSSQISSSRKRGYNPPEYSKQELMDWLFSKNKFHEIYDKWVESGYDKWTKPSVDRIDDYKGYSLGNIQIMTWRENLDKFSNDKKSGINNKCNKEVKQIDSDGNIIAIFHSQVEAGRVTGIAHQSINKSVNHGCKAGGFYWK